MSTDRDITPIVRSWLRTDEHESADRVLDVVFNRLDTTPQRRATWWPARRSSDMNAFAKLVLVADAAVVVAIIGLNLLPASGGFGGPGTSPVASPSPGLTPQPTASSTPDAAFPPSGEVTVGRQPMTIAGVPLSMAIPAGWRSNGEWGIDKGTMDTADAAGFILWPRGAPDNVFADPCSSTPLSPGTGPSAADLAAAVAAIPGTELVSGPEEVTVGGYPAQHVAIAIPDDIGCDPNDFYLWYDQSPSDSARYASEVGSTIHTWIIDVDGTLVWIDGETYAESGPGAEQEIRQMVDSIEFEAP